MRNPEDLLGRAVLNTAGVTPRGAATKTMAPVIRFGGPRVFRLWNEKSPARTPQTEATALRRRPYETPTYRPDPTELFGLDREVDE